MYTGHVTVDGPAAVHELARLMVTKVAVGPMDNNAYLLRDRATGTQVMIDAAADPERLIRLIGPSGLAAVITTHGHADHWQALKAVIAETGAASLGHGADQEALPLQHTRLLADGDSVQVGECALQVMHVRGHTPGSIALLYEDPLGHPHLFTGDSLFPGGLGKTWSDADFQQLYDDVTTKIFDVLPDDTWVYPGHGNDTTLGEERPQLSDWLARRW